MVYLIHFKTPWKHAQHYLGATTQPLGERLLDHYKGGGARLLQVLKEEKIEWTIARLWLGDFEKEKQLKKRHSGKRLCPICQGKVSYTGAEQKAMDEILEQVKAERDEMERQMISFRDQLEAVNFWKNAFKNVIFTPDGVTLQTVERELQDYYWLMQSVGKVYHHITEGHVQQQATQPEEVIRVAEDIVARRILEAEEKLQAIHDADYDEIDSENELNKLKIDNQKSEMDSLHEENIRLLKGEFTDKEFQDLCHYFSEKPDKQKEFAQGCMDYMKKLFGGCPLTWKEPFPQVPMDVSIAEQTLEQQGQCNLHEIIKQKEEDGTQEN